MLKKRLLILMAVLLLLTGCGTTTNDISPTPTAEPTATVTPSPTPVAEVPEITKPAEKPQENAAIEIHFLDVGQADSILVKTPDGKSMLIDAGNNADGQEVVSYIKKQNISRIDVLVGTHPHEDHIGGMDNVINSFDIDRIYMPKVSHTTRTYEDVLTAIKNKGLKVTSPAPGTSFSLGEAKCTVLAPNSDNYDDLNNFSIVIKLEYGNISFLFTGDAEEVSEREMLSKSFDLSADVLKIGHHGSSSSTSPDFLKKVSPKYAVISAGKGNDYGHPSSEVMNRLKNANIPVYRTDENGTIVCTSDGKSIEFNVKPGSYSHGEKDETPRATNTPKPTATPGAAITPKQSSNTSGDRIVYYTPNGKSYHFSKNCSTLKRSKTILEGKLSDVIKMGKDDPCNICAGGN